MPAKALRVVPPSADAASPVDAVRYVAAGGSALSMCLITKDFPVPEHVILPGQCATCTSIHRSICRMKVPELPVSKPVKHPSKSATVPIWIRVAAISRKLS